MVLEQEAKFAAENPINRSSSKQMFSFSKSPRKSMAIRHYTDAIYDMPSSVKDTMLNHKKTPSFKQAVVRGVDRVSHSMRRQFAPPPNTYNLRTSFDMDVKKKKGPKFGLSHKAYVKVYSDVSEDQYKGWTEPGAYDLKSFVDIAI